MINTSQLARIAIIVFLIAGCLYVLKPFLAAILLAVVICVFSWPFYERLWIQLGRRDGLSAAVMTLLLLVALILPMAYLAASLADSVARLSQGFSMGLTLSQMHPPKWISNIPLIGQSVSEAWESIISSQEALLQMLRQFYEPARKFGLRLVQILGVGSLQLLLVVFVAFFFYRDGPSLGQGMLKIVRKLGGKLGEEMLNLSCNMINGVMIGIFGTALAQAIVALTGFLIAGVPMPVLLASVVFVLSIVPVIGPPLVWIPAAFWLYTQGDYGWAIFMLVYGLLVISSVDNLLRPALISHTAQLPMLLSVLGIFGGALAFGFIGIFLGPVLLAVGMSLVVHWITRKNHVKVAN